MLFSELDTTLNLLIYSDCLLHEDLPIGGYKDLLVKKKTNKKPPKKTTKTHHIFLSASLQQSSSPVNL